MQLACADVQRVLVLGRLGHDVQAGGRVRRRHEGIDPGPVDLRATAAVELVGDRAAGMDPHRGAAVPDALVVLPRSGRIPLAASSLRSRPAGGRAGDPRIDLHDCVIGESAHGDPPSFGWRSSSSSFRGKMWGRPHIWRRPTAGVSSRTQLAGAGSLTPPPPPAQAVAGPRARLSSTHAENSSRRRRTRRRMASPRARDRRRQPAACRWRAASGVRRR